jgi:hypothetical protein
MNFISVSSKFPRRLISTSYPALTDDRPPNKRTSALENNLPLTREQRAKREEFLAFERDWESRVDYNQLSDVEKCIHAKHKEAIEAIHWTYIDPESRLKVITRLRHFMKGSCCGNACRHCVYNHIKVPEEVLQKRRFNSAFWTNK